MFACSSGTKLPFGGDPLGQCQCVGVWERIMYFFFCFLKTAQDSSCTFRVSQY
jgi:hypothetical protein